MTTGTASATANGMHDFVRPYGRSWVNALLDGIERMPGPTWAVYLVFVVAMTGLAVIGSWVGDIAPVGTVDPIQAFWGFMMGLTLWLFHYLDGVARSALDGFRPALTATDADFEPVAD